MFVFNIIFSHGLTLYYDANGNLTAVAFSTAPANNRTFVNDAAGRALYAYQGGNVQRQLIVNGEVLARHGVGVSETDPVNPYTGNPNFVELADFNFGYRSISANYPAASPGAYTVRNGDTLQSIAQSAYGDGKLWYRIAEANGLSGDRDLRVGQTLNLPNLVGTVHNDVDTFKPY